MRADRCDGLARYGLAEPWELLVKHNLPSPIVCKITETIRAPHSCGGIFDFPSTRFLTAQHIILLQEYIKVVYFVADPRFCIDACKGRSMSAKTALHDDDHWYRFNENLARLLGRDEMRPYCIEVLHRNGERKSVNELQDEIARMAR